MNAMEKFTVTSEQQKAILMTYFRVTTIGAPILNLTIRVLTPSYGESGAILKVEHDTMLAAIGSTLGIPRETCKASAFADPEWVVLINSLLGIHKRCMKEVEKP